MRAAVITRHGDPDVLEIEDVSTPVPGTGQVLVRVEAAGLNFHDIIERRSGYPEQPEPPIPTGLEGAGEVVQIGSGVGDPNLVVGTRVMWAATPGSHAEYVAVPAAQAIPLPDWLDSERAASICSQGLTAHYLATSLRDLHPGHTALVWAAAGGVGRILTQMLVGQGVRVIGASSSREKLPVVSEAGAEIAVLNGQVAEAVATLTGGHGVDIAFDGIGAPTFETSLSSVRSRGLLVVYGRSGGQVPPVALERLSGAGSVALIRPRLADFIATREELLSRAAALLAWLQDRTVTARIDVTFPLEGLADAHRRLESGRAVGKVIIRPLSPSEPQPQ